MNFRLAVAVSVVAVLSLTACATQEDAAESDGTWVGTITTEGNVTTVVNESGSVRSALGTYSVISFSWVQRTREVGVRVVFGASARDVFALVLLGMCEVSPFGNTQT